MRFPPGVDAVLTIFAVTCLVFAFQVAIPGDSAEVLTGIRFGTETPSIELVNKVRSETGLDRPVVERYFAWLRRVAHGDLGKSSVHGRSVLGEIAGNAKPTVALAMAGMGITLLGGLGLGCWAAAQGRASVFRRHWLTRWLDLLTHAGSVIGSSIPVFWMANILIVLFAVKFRMLPSAGNSTIVALVLPSMAVSAGQMLVTARFLRGRLLDVLDESYIRAARARGFGEARIFLVHALPNAIGALVPLLAVQFVQLLEGTVVVETVFSRAGIGRLLVDSVFSRDFPVLQGCLLVFSLLCVCASAFGRLIQISLWPESGTHNARVTFG